MLHKPSKPTTKNKGTGYDLEEQGYLCTVGGDLKKYIIKGFW